MHPFRRPCPPLLRVVAAFGGTHALTDPFFRVRQQLAATAALWTTALALSSPAHAQAMGDALRAADPATPTTRQGQRTLPPVSMPDAAALPSQPDQVRDAWRRANDRVKEFPRGHIDLLVWEARNGATATKDPATTASLDADEAVRLALRQRPDLFTRPGMNTVERRQVQLAAADLVRQVQQAWLGAVAARQSLALQTQILDAANTGVELGQRMVAAGNWPKARLLREQLVQTAAQQATTRARMAKDAASEQLGRLLGLWNDAAVTHLDAGLPNTLPVVPASLEPVPDLEATALRNHPTLAAQRLDAQRDIAAVPAGRLAAWAATVDTALVTYGTRAKGGQPASPHIENLSLARDHALERAVEAEARLLQTATTRRSQAREAWARVQNGHALALHTKNVLVQLTQLMEQETLLRYNGMLASTWELLASARERNQALDAAVQAQHDFWSAYADWQALMAGGDYASPAAAGSEAGTAVAPQGH